MQSLCGVQCSTVQYNAVRRSSMYYRMVYNGVMLCESNVRDCVAVCDSDSLWVVQTGTDHSVTLFVCQKHMGSTLIQGYGYTHDSTPNDHR